MKPINNLYLFCCIIIIMVSCSRNHSDYERYIIEKFKAEEVHISVNIRDYGYKQDTVIVLKIINSSIVDIDDNSKMESNFKFLFDSVYDNIAKRNNIKYTEIIFIHKTSIFFFFTKTRKMSMLYENFM